MFESHFGFSAPPFQLNPDPTFYFGSKGHSNALAYLQYGVHQAEGFIVVTGDIGAGKTTLVRTLLEGLDATQVKAAQIASTQLDAVGLLQAMLTAFGVPHNPGAVSKASLISTLEAFFMTLAIKNKRALLVIDEAQNLSMDAIEELRMLSNFQLRKQALLQSFLVGQPELRGMIESQRLEQLRQRVIASCHLGPLDADETRRYIEHRLNRVGWSGNPSFEPEAFPHIHHATGGVPRRINLLCNRLLLSAFLENLTQVTTAQVLRIAQELRHEVGDATIAQPTGRVIADVPVTRRAPVAAAPVLDDVVRSPQPVAATPSSVQRVVRRELSAAVRTVLCVVDTPSGYLNAALLAASLEHSPIITRTVVVGLGAAQVFGPVENYAEVVDLPAIEVHLGIEGSPARRTAEAVLRVEALLDEFAPDLLVPLSTSDESVACALLASRKGVPVVRLDGGVRAPVAFEAARRNASLLDRVASQIFAPTQVAALTLSNEGIEVGQVQVMGSLTQDALSAADAASPLAQALMNHHGLTSGFALVTARVGHGRLTPQSLSKLVLMLSRVRGDLPMLWLVCGETQSALRGQGLGTVLSRSGISLASMPVFSSRLSILQRAACLITDHGDDLVDVAMSTGTPLLLLDETGEGGESADGRVAWLPFEATELGLPVNTRGANVVDLPIGETATSVAESMVSHLHGWLSRRDGETTIIEPPRRESASRLKEVGK